MNRRSFISSILTLGVAPLILPAATTYSRVWTPKRDLFGFALAIRGGEHIDSFCPIYSQTQFEKAKHTGNFTYLVKVLGKPFYGKPNACVTKLEPEQMVREIQEFRRQPRIIPEDWMKLYSSEDYYDVFRD